MRIPSYNDVIKRIPSPTYIPKFNTSGKLIICLVEYRIMDEIDYVINAMLRVYGQEEIGFSIVHGTTNHDYLVEKYGKWENIKLINTGHENLNRGTYSALLKTPQLWENFTKWSHVLIYQTDALIMRKIDDVYFDYDYIGSPWSNKNQWTKYNAGNGGFSLRRVWSMIKVCEPYRNVPFEKIHRGNEDGFFSSQDSYKYPPTNSLLHQAFAVERVKHKFPVGCHQVYYCWDMNNNEWKDFLKYVENNLILNNKTHVNIKSIAEAEKFYKVAIKNEDFSVSKEDESDSNIKYEFSQIMEVLDYKYHVGPFELVCKDLTKNCWNIKCNHDYEILFCNKPDPQTMVETHKIEKQHMAVVHKRDKGVKYMYDDVFIYVVFYPGFPEGGKSNCDIHAPWGTNFNKNRGLPRSGAIILKTYISEEKYEQHKHHEEIKELQKLEKDKKNSKELSDLIVKKYKLDKIKSNIFLYDLFTGVGFYNQLFSLELGIYLAYISKRHLIINMKHPLVACGRPVRDYGSLLDYLNDDYKKMLPNGFTLLQYDKCIQSYVNEIEVPSKMSNIAIIDDEYITKENTQLLNEFSHSRQQVNFKVFDKMFDEKLKIVSFTKSNASRIFNNFYTNQRNYQIMNQVALAVTNYNPFLKNVYNQVVNNLKHKEYIALHLRFGDWHKNMNVITSSNNSIESNISAWLAKHNMSKVPLYIMTDRKDNPFFQSLKSQYEVVMIDELISQRVKLMLKNKYKNTGLAEFLIQKKICENAKVFIGSQGSTVSTHVQYMNYLNNKEYELHTHIKSTNYNKDTLKFNLLPNKRFSWSKKNYLGGHPVGWSLFFEDNITKLK